MKMFSHILLNRKQNPLSYRLLFYVVMCSSILALVTTVVQLYSEYKKDISSIEKNFKLIEEGYLYPISTAVYKTNQEQLSFLLHGATKLEYIEFIEVKELRNAKEIIFTAGNPSASKDTIRSFSLEYVKPSGQEIHIGTLKATASLKGVYERLWSRIVIVFTTNIIKTFMASICILLIIQLLITRHLNKISNYARQLDLNQLDSQLVLNEKKQKSSDPDEIDQIVLAINILQERVKINFVKQTQAEDELRRAHDTLEIRVENRTSELMEANRKLSQEIGVREQVERKIKESEELFRAVFEQTGGACMILRPSDSGIPTILDVNNIACKVHGYSKEEMIGRPVADLDDEEGKKLCIERTKTIMSGKPLAIETNHVRKDGSIFPVAVYSNIVQFEDKPPIIVTTEFDITERKQAEEALREIKDQLQTSIDNMPTAYILWDTDLNVLEWNKAAERIFGYSKEEMLGKNPVDYIVPEDARHLVTDILKKLQVGDVAAYSEKDNNIRKDGEIISCQWINTPLGDKDGNIFSILTVAQDITERKRAEEEREKLQAQLNEAQKMEAIGTMAGGLAHDYNNLLGAIVGNIDLAEEDAATGSPQAKALNVAMRAAQQAALLAKKFITFSSGGSPVKTAINPQELIKDTVNIALSGSNIQCDFSIDQDLGTVEIDHDQMSQAIGNIITNAKEAMPQGGTIHLMAQNMSGEQITHKTGLKLQGDFFIKIAVEDQGKGVPKKVLANIFDPYFSSKERGAQKGMGLGLTIANSIIHKHGGHIQVESEEGKGTTVSIYLPVLQQNEAVVCQSTDKVVDSPSEAREKKTTKILIMDDEEMISDMAKRMLEALGYEQVEVAPHGEDALKMYAQARDHGEPFDLLLIDLTIKGGMGGEEMIQRLYEMNPEVRAIVCSGYSKDPVVANYAAYGFIGVLAKPFSREELDIAITKALNIK